MRSSFECFEKKWYGKTDIQTGGERRVMENTRSYMSRFSGLGLFILAVAVVGLLVWLTVRSADNNDTAVTGTDTEQQAEADANGTDQTPATNGFDDEDEATDGNDGDEVVAGNRDDVAADNLPETGAESVLLPALALGAVTWAVAENRRSAKALIDSQR